MHHRMKRLIAALTVASICMVLVVGCSVRGDSGREVVPMEPEEVASWSPSYIGGKDVMQARGLPGLLAPESAGALIAQVITQWIKEK